MWSSLLLLLPLLVVADQGPDPSPGGPGSGTIYTIDINANNPSFVCEASTILWSVTPALLDPSLAGLNMTIGYLTDSSGSNLIASNVPISLGTYDWDPVNVPAGNYTIFARALTATINISGKSPTFAIEVDINHPPPTCLSTSSSNSDPTQLPTNPSSTGGSGSNPSSPVTFPSGTSSPSTNGTSIPVQTLATTHISTGLKAGLGIIGVVVAGAALAALYWFFVHYRRNNNKRANRYPGAEDSGAAAATGGGAKRQWDGLGSVDEYAAVGTSASREIKSFGSASYTQPSHTGAVASHYSESRTNSYVHPHSPVFDEKPSAMAPVYAEGMSYPPQDISPSMGYLPPVMMHDSHSPPRSPIYSSPAVQMVRTASDASSGSRARTASTNSHEFPYPIAGVNGVPERRPSANAVAQKSGLAARKPVPSYNSGSSTPEEEVGGRPSSSYLDPFAGSPESSEQLHVPNPINHPELQHKASFGEKPMQHVLIPDMPAPRVASPPIDFVRR